MGDDGYNGWANYETWCVHLWLSNDPWTEAEYREIVNNQQADAWKGAKALREHVQDAMPIVEGMWLDLLTMAMSAVDWDEVAAAFRDDPDDADSQDSEYEVLG